MASEEGPGSEMWPLVCLHGTCYNLGDVWYTFDYEKLSLVAQLKAEKSGGWTIMGDDIYWAGGTRVASGVSKNLLKHNTTIPRSTTWETIFDEMKLVRESPFVVPVDRKLYVLGSNTSGSFADFDSTNNYLGEVYDLDSKKWEQVLKLDDDLNKYRYFSASCAAVMQEKGGVPTTVVFYSTDIGRMLFCNLKEDTLRYEYHPSLNLNSGDPQGLEAILCSKELKNLRTVCRNSRPVVRDSTLYWFTFDLYLYGYDFVHEKWLASPCLKSEISIMSPCGYGGYGAVLVDLCNENFLAIRHEDCGVAIASFTVVKGEDSLSVLVETRNTIANLSTSFMFSDGMAMTDCKVLNKAKNSYTNGIHPMFKVVSDIVDLQHNHDMASYLGQIRTLKDQFNSLMPSTNDRERQQRDILFMAIAFNGQREDIAVRHQILSSPLIPTFEEVLARLLSSSTPDVTCDDEMSEMAVQSSNSGRRPREGKEMKHCTHCDGQGHTRDNCCSLHGITPRTSERPNTVIKHIGMS